MTARAVHLCASLLAVLLVLAFAREGIAQEGRASNTEPLSFGFGQAIIDLNRLDWGPLVHEGVPAGPEIAVLRGSLAGGPVEVVLRLPANYTFPNHSHISSEVYLWVAGDFTYVAKDGTAVDLSGQTFISLPGSVPHALICKDKACMFYVRYARSFNMRIHPMPKLKRLAVD